MRCALPFGAALEVTVDFSAVASDMDERVELLKRTGMKPLLEGIATILREDARNQFAEGGDPAWRPLAASTIAEKALAGLPAKTAKGRIPTRLKQGGQFGASGILIRTGALRDSWGRKDSPDHIEVIDVQAGEVQIGSARPYAAAQQEGVSAHTILVKAGKALAFTSGSGAMVFRREVKHPGLVARPVRISDDARARIKALVASYLDGDTSALNAPNS